MCGLFAVIQRRGAISRAAVEAATATIAHRGPDHTGILMTKAETREGSVEAGFGHQRLSIIDLDERSHQPFDQGEGVLVYNGEIYDHAEHRGRFEALGPLRTSSDTEILHRSLLVEGDAGLDRFNGMWAFCFLDRARRKIVASRDRYGKKPLFYAFDGDTFCMASEAKAIFAYLGRKPSMRPDMVASYLAFGMSCPRADGTMFLDGVREVRPGHTLELDLHHWTLVERRWHDFAARAHSDCPDLAQAFETAVLARLVSDRPVGLLLSGGIDSSIILSVLMKRGLQHQVHCFIGETGANISEDAAYARQCASIAGVTAREFAIDYGAKAFDRILSMCRHHEKPFPLTGNSVAMHEMYSHIAGYDVPVVLDGTGGDETFGGYWDRYVLFAIRDAMRAGDVGWLAEAMSAARDDQRTEPLFRNAFQRITGSDSRSRAASAAAIEYGRPSVRDARSDDPLETFDGDLADAMALDAVESRLSEWIWHNDRNAMAFGIENRSPFLDVGLIPAIGMHYARKFNGPWNKVALRELFGSFAELPTQWRRQKQGFRWSVGLFLRSNRPKIAELISGSVVLREHVDIARYLDAANTDKKLLVNEFVARLFCVAGLEAALDAQLK